MKNPDPLTFLQAVYMNVELPLTVRMRAAIEILPYTHPRLAVTAVVNEGSFAELLDRRLARMEQLTEVRQIEASPTKTTINNAKVSEVIEAKPSVPNRGAVDRKWRRI